MFIDILSLFPEYFEGPLSVSILKRALENKLLQVNQVNIRDFAKDKHKTVDDRPFGGGPGMVLMPEPLAKAIKHVKKNNSHVIYLSPRGIPLNAKKCAEMAHLQHIVLVCGHYEGIDERVIEEYVDEEISIGDYVLTSGLPAAAVLIDAVARFIPGVLGHEKAAEQDSFENGLLAAPHYTRPFEFQGRKIPEVLREGHHGNIQAWNHQKSLEKTALMRKDLYQAYLERQNKMLKENTNDKPAIAKI